ncbi:ergosterol biosynthetic protein 28 homolog isoform X1 [Apteryx mantelli]|uniref:Ergosterol biosynthetic protein 28 homolog isoform X1 n=1 Tax=Apteryx mantelli TaxID=2696672 RepID=A0ABM4EJR9_9AVES
MSRFLNVLRSWLVMVSVIAAGNTLQSFRDHRFLSEKLYTGTPGLVNGLQARTFGIWTLLSSVIRCLCAIDIRNKTFLYPGDVDWAAVPGGRSTVTKEEKLKLNAWCRSVLSPIFTAKLPLKLSCSFTRAPVLLADHCWTLSVIHYRVFFSCPGNI